MAINLALMRDDAIYNVEQSIFVIGSEPEWKEFQLHSKELCNNFLTIAAAALLADMKPSNFFINLCRCAENWRRFLRLSQSNFQQTPNLFYNTPLLAAIISDEQNILNGIQSAMPVKWQKGEEYQDQFHISWLMLLLGLAHSNDDALVLSHINELETYEKEPKRIILIKALLNMDELTEDDFWDQFESLLYEHEEDIEKKSNSLTTPERSFAPYRYIWYEGLTWLRLAKKKSFTPRSKNIIFCPDEALMDMPEPYNNDWIIMPDKSII